MSKTSGFNRSQVFTFLKQALLFFPATFVLWITAGEFVYMSLMGSNPFQPLPIAVVIVVSFMTVIGIGDVRRLKDYVIPVSIMGVGAFAATLVWLTGWDALRPDQFGILFFPAALIAPFIAKFLVK